MSFLDDDDESLEHTLFTHKECLVYNIPPLADTRGHKAADWRELIFTGRIRLTAKGPNGMLYGSTSLLGMWCKRCLWRPRYRGRYPPRSWWERSFLQWGSGCQDGTPSKQLWMWHLQTLSNVPSSNQSVSQTPLCSTCRPGRRCSRPLSWPE